VIKGVHFVRKRLAGGKMRWYVYAWRGGPQVASHDGPRKPALEPAVLKLIVTAVGEREASADETVVPDPRLLSSLIGKWQRSPDWKRMTASTQKTWQSPLNLIERKWGTVPLAVFNDTRMTEKIMDWRDSRQETPRGADIGIQVMKALLAYGMQRGLLKFNAAAGIGTLYRGGQREEIIWEAEDLRRFAKAATDLGAEPVYDALRLATVTGLRREDLVTLTEDHVRQFAVIKRAKKESRGRRRFARIPRIPELDRVLADLRDRPRQAGVDTILVDGDGMPWEPDELTKAVAGVRDSIGIFHIDPETKKKRRKHLHDARGTFATKLMTDVSPPLSDEEIADIMGWSTATVARIRKVYVDQTARIVAVGRRIARGCKPEL
jgi:hypothetical protein